MSPRRTTGAFGPGAMKRPIKVLHIIKTLGLGGAETNLANLVQAFDAQRIETHVGYSFGGEIEPRFRNAGVRLFKYASRSHKIKSPHSLLIVLRLAAYIRRHRIDIVQTHNFNGHVWGLLAARLGGAKVIEHVHDFRYTPTEELARRHGLLDQYRFIRYFRRRSDRVIVLTKAHRNYVIAHGLSTADKVLELQNGIAVDRDEPVRTGVRERLAIPADAFVVLTSARMDPSKNIDLVVRIASAVAAAAPAVLFLIAGSGTHLDRYRALGRQLGVEAHVRFIGFHQDMFELLGIADAFLLPSFLELHSIAILEAQKMQVPIVISSGVGCNDEFVEDGRDGFLCDPFVEKPWVDAVVRLAHDAPLRRRVGANGRDTCRRLFNLPDTAARFERVYADVAA